MTEIIVAVITGGLALIGVIITSRMNNRDIEHKLEIHQAVTDEKITELTREVREHNNFAQRVPIIEEQLKVLNHRIDNLNHS